MKNGFPVVADTNCCICFIITDYSAIAEDL